MYIKIFNALILIILNKCGLFKSSFAKKYYLFQGKLLNVTYKF